MIVYVETNFVLELVFAQEQSTSCEQILALSESGKANLVAPAYCLAEPYEKLTRQAHSRRILQQDLRRELRQATRTESYAERIGTIVEIEGLLAQSIQEEQQRFVRYRDRFLRAAEIVPLTVEVLQYATTCEAPLSLAPPDAIVYASVVMHLREQAPSACCFLNKNRNDFDNPDIVDELAKYNCRMIPPLRRWPTFHSNTVTGMSLPPAVFMESLLGSREAYYWRRVAPILLAARFASVTTSPTVSVVTLTMVPMLQCSR